MRKRETLSYEPVYGVCLSQVGCNPLSAAGPGRKSTQAATYTPGLSCSRQPPELLAARVRAVSCALGESVCTPTKTESSARAYTQYYSHGKRCVRRVCCFWVKSLGATPAGSQGQVWWRAAAHAEAAPPPLFYFNKSCS